MVPKKKRLDHLKKIKERGSPPLAGRVCKICTTICDSIGDQNQYIIELAQSLRRSGTLG
jgi:hypothetical protein